MKGSDNTGVSNVMSYINETEHTIVLCGNEIDSGIIVFTLNNRVAHWLLAGYTTSNQKYN